MRMSMYKIDNQFDMFHDSILGMKINKIIITVYQLNKDHLLINNLLGLEILEGCNFFV